jgi:hypothetical protein
MAGFRPNASWHETDYRGGMLPGGGEDSLARRKSQLLQWLAQRGGSAPNAASAVGRMGGIGGRAPLPSMTYNPYLTQITGRANEQFIPGAGGFTADEASRAQMGQFGPMTGHSAGIMGGFFNGPDQPPTPSGIQPFGPPQTPQAPGPNIFDPAPGTVQPQGGFSGGRSLIGAGSPIPQQLMPQPSAGPTSILPQSFDPYLRLAAAQGRSGFRE